MAEVSTATIVRGQLTDRDARKRIPVTETHTQQVTRMLAWAQTAICGKESSERSDYEHNLAVVLAAGLVTGKNVGLVAALIAVYGRALRREAEHAALRQQRQHVGTVGKRETFTLRVKTIVDIESPCGTQHLHIFQDQECNLLVWKTAANRLDEGAW